MASIVSLRGPGVAVAMAAGVLAACAYTPPSSEQLGAGRAAIQAAQAEGANDAAPEMAMARDKLAQADLAARSGDDLRARRLAEEAAVDAQVARSRIEADKSRRAAAEVEASLAALRDEMLRQSNANTAPVRP